MRVSHTITPLIVAVALLSGCIVKQPAGHAKFMSFRHRHGVKQGLLIRRVDKPQWKIGYRFEAECQDDFRRKEPQLKEAVTTALRLWLKPLHALKLPHPITDAFLYLRQADFHGNESKVADQATLRELDARITFGCKVGRTHARIWLGVAPEVYLRAGTDIDNYFMYGLIHELGHAFGLEDTYVMRNNPGSNLKPMQNKGGLSFTVGTQPASIMSGERNTDVQILHITEDDKRGIEWLYRHFYEGLPIEDCLFPDYVLEEEPRGCIPKYPLIFEVKHASPPRVTRMLDEDPNLDVNAQDAGGFTALHYAVMYEQEEVVAQLLV